MANRPPIPAELRRRVLVEAGHRCAIHSCRQPEIDVHHIVPWERCQEHAYDNLIALCPNCHRRADSGEIDRKSLQMYKVRLQAGVTAADRPAAISVEASGYAPGTSEWRGVLISENRTDPPSYEVEIEVPEFTPLDLADVNAIERAWALLQMQSFRSRLLSPLEEFDGDSSNRGWRDSLSGSFEVLFFGPTVASFRYSLLSYGVGAAHPNGRIRCVTVQRNPAVMLALRDLFIPGSPYVERLSEISTRSLANQLGDAWFSEGAGAKEENFCNFNVTRDGLLLTFPEYQVAAYAAGSQYVTVRWVELQGILNPLCRAVPCS